MMTDYFKAEDSEEESDTEEAELTNPSPLDDKPIKPYQALAAFDYESDTSNDEPLDAEDEGNNNWMDEEEFEGENRGSPGEDDGGTDNRETSPEPVDQPRRKRQKRDIPVLKARQIARDGKFQILRSALVDIEKLIRSRKTKFEGGARGLQSYRAQAIESYLRLVVEKGRKGIPASETAAEGLGFARGWGGRQVRRWVRVWLNDRDLPKSERGCHVKVKSLFEDPSIKAELRTYLRSNKWALNPEKLKNFTNQKLLPDEAAKYCHEVCDKEMPQGLKKYMELELFPRIHMKVGKGISLSTARRWLQCEGFKYTVHKKAIYYDGHDRPDVVKYRQEEFLPAMAEHRKRMVEYKMGELTELLEKILPLGVRKLVLVAHDESTCTANDGPKSSWVPDGEQPILKKGAGRGSHRSDVICSTYGWLENAGVQLEYGKNYEGYWTGKMFVEQVRLFLQVLFKC